MIQAATLRRIAIATFSVAALCLSLSSAAAGTTRPYYQRRLPSPQVESDFASDSLYIDLRNAHLDPYGTPSPVAAANRLYDKRTAAAVRATTGIDFFTPALSNGITVYVPQFGPRIFPHIEWRTQPLGDASYDFPYGVNEREGKVAPEPGQWLYSDRDLLEMKWYGYRAGIDGISLKSPTIYLLRGKCLGLLAYADYFPGTPWQGLRSMVSTAIMEASPGWCGTFGPNVSMFDVLGHPAEGNYDMTQMFLLPMIYGYYDELTPEARERLIVELLAHGVVFRPGVDPGWTHGVVPADWSRAGFISIIVPGPIPFPEHIRIGETENHILMIATVRYLANQLLYQRNPHPDYDNRRNGSDTTGSEVSRPSCRSLLLYLLQGFLRDDFSEYNAKNYQSETRQALLNLCSYAYDHEVRLAARMVLDYISARMAVSSCDLRRMPPFRRRNEDPWNKQLPGGFMDVGLVEPNIGTDPMISYFAAQTGQTRAYAQPHEGHPWEWSITGDVAEPLIEALSDYRVPPLIHDLFINDSHRRFFQRLHRRLDEPFWATGRNADNMEIYAGSPSYLITAGGAPATFAIDPSWAAVFTPEDQLTQRGVAVTTSFMPTGQTETLPAHEKASDLIQFGMFSDGMTITDDGEVTHAGPNVGNYGVAPDFACGHQIHIPDRLKAISQVDGRFTFVNKRAPQKDRPGFYLAILRDGELACMEAFDTWLHPEVTYEQFKARVKSNNSNLRLQNNVEADYTTYYGNQLHFVIWAHTERDFALFGAKVLSIRYADPNDPNALGDAARITGQFLNGTIMNSPSPGVIIISNPALGRQLTLDMSDPARPRRISEDGSVEQAGPGSEVWVDFGWAGPSEGDFYRPFKTLAAAVTAVAPGGTIKIVPGSTTEPLRNPAKKPFRLVAPIGGVRIGAR